MGLSRTYYSEPPVSTEPGSVWYYIRAARSALLPQPHGCTAATCVEGTDPGRGGADTQVYLVLQTWMQQSRGWGGISFQDKCFPCLCGGGGASWRGRCPSALLPWSTAVTGNRTWGSSWFWPSPQDPRWEDKAPVLATQAPPQAGAPAPTEGLFLPILFPFPSCAERPRIQTAAPVLPPANG